MAPGVELRMDDDRERAHAAWNRAATIRRLSDRVIALGPWGLGMDGVLSWVPIAGTVYSIGAAAFLLNEAVQAKASRSTLLRMAAYLGVDSLASGVPIIGWALDTLFTAHAFAARALQKDIERRHGAPKAAARPKAKLEPKLFTGH